MLNKIEQAGEQKNKKRIQDIINLQRDDEFLDEIQRNKGLLQIDE